MQYSSSNVKIALVVGTRPEIIKMSPIIRALKKRGERFFILHTGQHYSHTLDKVFFDQLKLPSPNYNLTAGSGPHGEQTARILSGAEQVFLHENPDIVIAEGDTNSVLACSLAAVKLHIKVGHVEAGLRSYDRTMPEEINRILADHCADYLFAPTANARTTLLQEGISDDRVIVTGNTIVDAVQQNLELANEHGDAINELGLCSKGFFLVTIHRQENVDNQSRFSSILMGLDKVASKYNMPIIYAIHPRARKMILQFSLQPSERITIVEHLDFFNFLQLESNARLILTDSGGVQEEACILGVPCVTLRDNTERPETLDVGANILAGTSSDSILKCSQSMMSQQSYNWINPFGDGKAGEKIVDLLLQRMN